MSSRPYLRVAASSLKIPPFVRLILGYAPATELFPEKRRNFAATPSDSPIGGSPAVNGVPSDWMPRAAVERHLTPMDKPKCAEEREPSLHPARSASATVVSNQVNGSGKRGFSRAAAAAHARARLQRDYTAAAVRSSGGSFRLGGPASLVTDECVTGPRKRFG